MVGKGGEAEVVRSVVDCAGVINHTGHACTDAKHW